MAIDKFIKEIITGKEVEVPEDVTNILESGEKIIHAFQQGSITGKFGGAESIYITDLRIIKLMPNTFGLRAEIRDFLYKDMANVTIDRGMTRTNIRVKMRFQSHNVFINKIPKDAGNQIFRTIQDGIAGRLSASGVSDLLDTKEDEKLKTRTTGLSIPNQIRELSKLKTEGLIAEVEFEQKKKKLLERM